MNKRILAMAACLAVGCTLDEAKYVSGENGVKVTLGDGEYKITLDKAVLASEVASREDFRKNVATQIVTDFPDSVQGPKGDSGTDGRSVEIIAVAPPQPVDCGAPGGSTVDLGVRGDTATTRISICNGAKGDKGDKGDMGPPVDMSVLVGLRDDIELLRREIASLKQGWRIKAHVDVGVVNLSRQVPTNSPQTIAVGGSALVVSPVTSAGAAPMMACANGVAPTGLSCTGANREELGLVFTIPSPGVYRVCSHFPTSSGVNASGILTTWSLVETSPTSSSIIPGAFRVSAQTGGRSEVTGAIYHLDEVELCEAVAWPAAGQKAVRILFSLELYAGGAGYSNLIGSQEVLQLPRGGIVRWDIEQLSSP